MENIHIGKVVRIGTGLGVIIPRAILRGVNLQRGDQVVFCDYVEGGFSVRVLSDKKIKEIKEYVATHPPIDINE